MDTNIHNNSLNGGGGNNNVIIRIPSVNEHSNILLNSDLNGSIDIASSKLNVWNFKYNDTGFDFSILQDNSTYNFINLSKYWRGSWDFVQSYYTMDKSNKSIIEPDWDAVRDFTLPCFRPIFEFNKE